MIPASVAKFDAPFEDEYKLVHDAWAQSFRKSPWAGCIPNHLYDAVQHAASREIVERGARVIVMYIPLEDGGRRIAGYSVSEPERRVLHWLYVKKDYRGHGFGRRLLQATCPDGEWFYTYRTRASTKFLGSRFTHERKYACVKA